MNLGSFCLPQYKNNVTKWIQSNPSPSKSAPKREKPVEPASVAWLQHEGSARPSGPTHRGARKQKLALGWISPGKKPMAKQMFFTHSQNPWVSDIVLQKHVTSQKSWVSDQMGPNISRCHGWVIKWAPTIVAAFEISSYSSLNHDYGGKSSHGETMFWSWWKGCDRKVALSGGSIMNTLTSKCWKTSWKKTKGKYSSFDITHEKTTYSTLLVFWYLELQRSWQFRVPKFLSINFLEVSSFAPAVWCSCDVALSPVEKRKKCLATMVGRSYPYRQLKTLPLFPAGLEQI